MIVESRLVHEAERTVIDENVLVHGMPLVLLFWQVAEPARQSKTVKHHRTTSESNVHRTRIRQ